MTYFSKVQQAAPPAVLGVCEPYRRRPTSAVLTLRTEIQKPQKPDSWAQKVELKTCISCLLPETYNQKFRQIDG